MKLISFNVNGLRAIVKKEFEKDFKELNAEVFCLQEIKLSEGQLDLEFDNYTSYWNYAVKKGYSGTAVYTSLPVLSYKAGLDEERFNDEGRVNTVEFKDFFLVNVYTPNSKRDLLRIDYRMEWEDYFRNYVVELDKIKPVIICGDLNVAHREIDLANPKTNHFNPGFSDQERGKLTELLDAGFIDSFRYINGDVEAHYSWWSYRSGVREKNIGWRIDYFLVSKKLENKIVGARIRNDIYGSDHCPVELELDL